MQTFSQPMSTFALIETAKRILSHDLIKHDGLVYFCSRIGEMTDARGNDQAGFQAIKFRADGSTVSGLWFPSVEWDFFEDICEGTPGQFKASAEIGEDG